MSALPGRDDPAALKNAVWGSEPELLILWHGEAVPVRPGDRVRFYEPTDGNLIFVGINDGFPIAERRHGNA